METLDMLGGVVSWGWAGGTITPPGGGATGGAAGGATGGATATTATSFRSPCTMTLTVETQQVPCPPDLRTMSQVFCSFLPSTPALVPCMSVSRLSKEVPGPARQLAF